MLYVTKHPELGCSHILGVKKESSGSLRPKTRSGEEEKLLCHPGRASPDKPRGICASLLSVRSICTTHSTNMPCAESFGSSLCDPPLAKKKKKKRDKETRRKSFSRSRSLPYENRLSRVNPRVSEGSREQERPHTLGLFYFV